jgi:uncharacterized protein
MPVDHIRYDILAQEALRGVVRRVLADAAKKGMPGEHHFFIEFGTHAPDVRVSDRLRAQYPDKMTIVLQHQFWDLAVTEHAFEVGLSFNGIPERLFVPFSAITSFADPSVQFGMQFDGGNAEAPADNAAPAKPAPAPARRPSALPDSLRRVQATESAPKDIATQTEPAPDADAPDKTPDLPSGGAEVVRLDRFRKK